MGAPVGLTSAQARALLAQHGPNTVSTSTTRNRVARVLGPLADPMVILLIVASPVYLAIGERTDAIVAVVAVVPIVGVGWYLQAKAERGIARLEEMGAPTASVLRDGVAQQVPAREVVPGDILMLREGDIVAADATITDTVRIALDEAALTGESMPVDKGVADPVSAGTVVTAGMASALVTATGRRSALGQISELMLATQPPRTPLQRAMRRLVLRIAAVAAVGCVAVIGLELWRGHGWSASLIAGISLLIAAVPEEFSMVYALYLSIGAWYLARHRALVRTLPSAEALGSVTVVCTDKTGTVTQGVLKVAALHAITSAQQVVHTAVLASEQSVHDPLDAAIASHAAQQSVDLEAAYSRGLVDDWPFAGNRVTRVWRAQDGGVSIACKGALEALVELTHAPPDVRLELEQAHARMAHAGLRVIAVASGAAAAPSGERLQDEAVLHIDGLIGFEDPLRPGVADAVAECRAAGIRVVMITGDHPDTARAIAYGMSGDMSRVATGEDVAAATDDDALAHLVARTDVFARTKPQQKHALVLALQRAGEVVAMTGDGVNDAPALRAADIGVAMGGAGTAVARDAAALVLMDDDFATIVSAVRNGRRIYDNLGRAFRYLIAVHIPIILVAAAVPLLDWPLLLQPAQLVLLEVLLHPIVSLVFQSDPPESDAMRRAPRPADYALRWRALRSAVVAGLSLSVAVLAVYGTALHSGWDSGASRAAAFITLLVAQPPLLVVLRASEPRLWRTVVSREFAAACVACIGMAVAVVSYGPLLRLNHFASVPTSGWWLAVAAGATAALAPTAVRRLAS